MLSIIHVNLAMSLSLVKVHGWLVNLHNNVVHSVVASTLCNTQSLTAVHLDVH